jgi:hypothetical protein
LKKKKFLKNKPFDENDALQMQDWTEESIIDNARTLFSDGVVTGLNIVPKTSFKVNISVGKAFDINYKLISIDSTTEVSLDAPDSLNRYDAISLKYKTQLTDNIDTANKYGRGASWTYSQNILDKYDVVIRKGIPHATPTAPTVPNDEIHLANVSVRNGATSVTSGDIEDKRKIVQLAIKPDAEEFGLETPEGAQDKADKAELDAINWVKSFGLGDVAKRLQNTDDLNNLITTGFYYGWSSCGNMPVAVSCFLIVMRYNDDYTVQMAFQADASRRAYIRTQTGGNWSNWTENETTSGSQSKANTAENNAKEYVNEKIKNSIQRYTKQYSVNTNTPAIIKESNDTDLSLKYTYLITARTINTGSNVSSVAIFTPNDADNGSTSFNMEIINKSSENSNTPEFFIDVNGKPSVRLYNHTSLYTVELTIEKTRTNRHLYNIAMDEAQNKADKAKTDAINWAKGFGLGDKLQPYAGDLNSLTVTGFYYATTTAANKPNTNNGYIINIAYADTGFLSQIFIESLGANGAMHTRTKENGTWRSWTKIETSAGAQAKADAVDSKLTSHKNDKSNPHSVNSGQVNNITAKPSSESPDNYPIGVFSFDTTLGGGYPSDYGAVLTVIQSSHRGFQLVMGKNGGRFFRGAEGTTWTEWQELETTTGAQAKANAVQSNLNTHNSDSTKHITSTERNSWNAKETESGAQSKATAAKNAAIDWAKSFGLGTTAPSHTTNLDTIKEVGMYHYTPDSVGSPGSNYGIVLTFIRSGARMAQIAFTADGRESSQQYNRTLGTDGWGSWVEMETTSGSQAKFNSVQNSLNNHTGSGGSAHALATSGAHGFMRNTDKSKLDGIETGAEKNEAAFAYMKANGILSAASAVKDTFEFIDGSGISISMNATNDNMTISVDSSVVRDSDFNSSQLWSGVVYPTSSQTVTPSKRLSDCKNGWILIWSDYDAGSGGESGTTNDFHFVQTFIHKSQLNLPLNGGTFMVVPATNDGSEASRDVVKAVIVHDDRLIGYDSNNTVSWANDVVLRRVYEF